MTVKSERVMRVAGERERAVLTGFEEAAIHPEKKGPVIYWMSRSQRVLDNWSLLYARQLARDFTREMAVIFVLASSFEGARESHFRFMLEGLKQVEESLSGLNIPFFLLQGAPADVIPEVVRSTEAAVLVSEPDPLRIKKQWHRKVAGSINVPFVLVDSRNVVPLWVTSNKQEYAARTIRPKIHRLLPDYLEDFPAVEPQGGLAGKQGSVTGRIPSALRLSWDEARRQTASLPAGPDLSWIEPGEKGARKRLDSFFHSTLSRYHEERNDPNSDATSLMSPYLHFGHISSARIALEVLTSGVHEGAREAFLEELIVRRELSDNFCWYNPRYDSMDGFPDWARRTLEKHRGDKREYLYTFDQLDAGETHDELWNTAQRKLVNLGTMHGYLRMYWAKKILEWTASPEEALETTIRLNDSYQLDGRDSNGYTGAAWSVGGVHDRPWRERDIFGTIRYMNLNGCRKKFDVDHFCAYN